MTIAHITDDHQHEAQPLDHLIFCGDDNDVALILSDQPYSYNQLNLRIAMLAKWLMAQGCQSGDRVAAWLPKNLLTAIMPLTAARAGLVYIPANPLLKAPQIDHILADSGATLLIANNARLATLDDEQKAGNCRFFSWEDDCAFLNENLQDNALGADDDWLKPSSHDPQNCTAILYTSGSTGKPKGVMLSHENLWLGALAVKQYLHLQDDDRVLAVLPLSFDYGQNQLLSAWAAGACAVPFDYLFPRDVVKACAKHSITTLAAVPPLWVQLTEAAWPEEAARHMRRLTNSGGALTRKLVKKLRAIFPHSDIYAMYGLTEAFRSTYLDPTLIDENPTSMGRAIPFAEIIVVNDAGEAAQPDEEGELVHTGPLVALGYWRDEERTKERFRPAPKWSTYGGMAVWSGDRVRRDDDGLLYFVGRKDAMIKSMGNRISPSEIEEAVLALPFVSDALAMGLADEKMGQKIILYIRQSSHDKGKDEKGMDGKGMAREVTQYLRSQLPGFMVPHHVEILDKWPHNANGKIDRKALEIMAQNGQNDDAQN